MAFSLHSHCYNVSSTDIALMKLEPVCSISIGVAKRDLGLDKQKPSKILGILIWTQTGKRTYTRTLCQKNEGAVKIKQKPATMGDKTFRGHCHLKGHLFKLGLTK
jgi:hypothetical protein